MSSLELYGALSGGLTLTFLVSCALFWWWRATVEVHASLQVDKEFRAAGALAIRWGLLVFSLAGTVALRGEGGTLVWRLQFLRWCLRSGKLDSTQLQRHWSKWRKGRETAPRRGFASRPLGALSPGDWADLLFAEFRHVKMRQLDLTLRYAFEDLWLQGELMAALTALSAVIPPPLSLRHEPQWGMEDDVQGELGGNVQLRVAPMLFELARRYVVTLRRSKRKLAESEVT